MAVDQYVSRVESFLASNCDERGPTWESPPGVLTEVRDPAETVRRAVEFQRAAFGAGVAGPMVPAAFGGADVGEPGRRAFEDVAERYDVPTLLPLTIGLNLVVPTLLAHGSPEQRRVLIPRILSAEDLWCQLFSEPDAGSDLASLRTMARSVGDGFLVSGQKVWSSFADRASHGLLLSRTDASGRGHRGLTLFALAMTSPGVRVRPLREITGGTHFCEVFFDDVPVSADAAIGEVGQGWRTAMSTLGTERRGSSARQGRPRWERLAALRAPLGPMERRDVVDVHVEERVLALLAERIDHLDIEKGWRGAGGSLVKLSRTKVEKQASSFAVRLLGPGGGAWQPDDEVTAA